MHRARPVALASVAEHNIWNQLNRVTMVNDSQNQFDAKVLLSKKVTASHACSFFCVAHVQDASTWHPRHPHPSPLRKRKNLRSLWPLTQNSGMPPVTISSPNFSRAGRFARGVSSCTTTP